MQTTTSELAGFAGSKIEKLQDSYVFGDRAGSAAALANLRRSVSQDPGVNPDIWEVTLEGLPPVFVGKTDEATEGEKAVHAAMTLYAVHQQSKTAPMHRQDGPSLGRAMGKLAKAKATPGAGAASSAVKRRFDALVTAQSFGELVFHARGLIQQLRAENLALDYGRFAEDLRKLQIPQRADSVRRQWGRDYSYEIFVSKKNASEASATAVKTNKGVTQ